MTKKISSIEPRPRHKFIPYSTQDISEEDIAEVSRVLKSDWLTQGPLVAEFERKFAGYCNAGFASAVSSGSTALYVACRSIGLGPGNLLWTTPNTFVASANCALHCGADVDFVDIDRDTRNLSVESLRLKLERAEAESKLPDVLVVVHFAGHPCDMRAIHALCKPRGIKIIEDASHAIGGRYEDAKIGGCTYSDACIFSFHAVKTMTTGEGGMITTNDSGIFRKAMLLRSHGITRNAEEFTDKDLSTDNAARGVNPWYYEQQFLGQNYRITDIQCALGISQLARLDVGCKKRREWVNRYREALADLPLFLPVEKPYASTNWHLFAVEIDSSRTRLSRRRVFDLLREANIGVNVHYIPVHYQPLFKKRGFKRGDFPNAEAYYENAVTLPLHTRLSQDDFEYIVSELRGIFA